MIEDVPFHRRDRKLAPRAIDLGAEGVDLARIGGGEDRVLDEVAGQPEVSLVLQFPGALEHCI